MKTLTLVKKGSRVARNALLLASGLVFLAIGNLAHAGPIGFTIDDIKVEITDTDGRCRGCIVSGSADLPVNFFLSDIGDSETFDLFDLTLSGLSKNGFTADLVTTVSFSAPSSATSSAVSGSLTFSTSFDWWVGTNVGTLTFDPAPVDIAFSDGTSISLALSGESSSCTFMWWQDACGVTMDVAATSTLTATSGGTQAVPEPGTLALFGAGLVGFGAMRRRQLKAAK